MNMASQRGGAKTLRDWMTASDEWLSPQAAVLSPAATCRIAEAIVAQPDDYRRTIAAGQAAVAILKEGVEAGALKLNRKEQTWLDRLNKELGELPPEEQLLAEMQEQYGGVFDPKSYGL
jgi:hypothetical protein